ncbi:MAG: hypothetical protein GAK33_04966 [Burkholderia lata]|uniref:Uncharacterized protein n=1 Tax=Burkholderia lata (strain ATCC 17760 / DSM 23089 / LMG 22485 / NCIMB 9086 / R18194 / 383) TaxID=482957 RepID=A0A833PS87_BURL3|nr:hypothetical protein [Burkholderia lata]KAF1035058.1 MAG: hypothetical protein GAK33_04966 [Burkholderia lata]
MKRIARNPGKFEPLNLYTAIGREAGYEIGSEAHSQHFIEEVKKSLEAGHRNLNMLHGKRVEALFAHVAGALGQCLMVKAEDAGDVFVADESVKIPDYRLVLRDRSQLLVEVKNCHGDALDQPFSLKRDYIDQLDRYADMNGASLKFAVFFSSWRFWCLLSRQSFQEKGDDLIITFPIAVARNEMSSIGDVTIATLPELKLELLADPAEAHAVDEHGQAPFIIRSAKIFCAGNEIVDRAEQGIAFKLMQSGKWPDTSEFIVEDGKLLGIVITARPETAHEGQQFESIGSLSFLVTSAYGEMTVKDSRPIALDVAADPAAFALYIPEGYKSDTLPLWRIVCKPNPDVKFGGDNAEGL